MAKRPNEKNERIKRDYLHYRKHAKQCSTKTLDREIAALERFDVWNGRKDFVKFHINWAMQFRTHLEQAKTAHGRPLSKSTQRAIMAVLRDFTIWLSQQDGFRRRIKLEHADYFRLSLRDEAEARAAPESPAPSIKQAKRVLEMMPETTPRELRDKALVSLLCLCGPRVGAIATLRIKHVDLDEKCVKQNPREVATKFGKPIDSFFHKGFPEAEAVLEDGKDLASGFGRCVFQMIGFGERRDQGLFADDMGPCGERLGGGFEMQVRRQADVDDVDAGREDVFEMRRDRRACGLCERCRAVDVEVADMGDPEEIREGEVARDMLATDAGTYDGDAAGHLASAFICAAMARSMTLNVWACGQAVAVLLRTSSIRRPK